MTRTPQPKTASLAGTGLPRQRNLARPGWWLTFTDLMALMVASLVLLYAMGAPRIPSGFVLPGVLDGAPDTTSALPPARRTGTAPSQRAALTLAPLAQALSDIGLTGATVEKIGLRRLLIRLSANDIQRVFARPDLSGRLASRIAAAGWTGRELVLVVDGDPAPEHLAGWLARLSSLRALGAPSVTIQPLTPSAAHASAIRALLLELAPMGDGTP